MTTALMERDSAAITVTGDQLDLVKRTIASGASDAELKLYLYDCQRQGVHPLDRLLHFTKRGGKYTPVTSIDLMRIRAAETGEYAGNEDAYFTGTPMGADFTARVSVYRIVQAQRCEFVATARWSEYYPGDQGGHMWKKMPHTMLAKCAEALALRKGFPRQLAGLYASEELDQADRPTSAAQTAQPRVAVENRLVAGNEHDKDGAPVYADVHIDQQTGEERPEPPPGYHYIAHYQFKNGWHEFDLIGADAQGGAMRLSTKKDIGFIAEQAAAEGVPVKVSTAPKKNARPGEAYLNAIEKLAPLPEAWKPFATEPSGANPIDDDSIPF